MYRLVLTLLCSLQLFALKAQELRFASILSDGAVLQQKCNVKIWGSSAPLRSVTVTPSWTRPVMVKSDSNGLWCAEVRTPGADYKSHTISAKSDTQNIIIKDIVLGEVWLISGQSNMEMTFYEDKLGSIRVDGAKEVIEGKEDKFLRSFNVARCERFYQQDDIVPNGGWKTKNPKDVVWFSAVGYFFGKMLREKLNVPVGLVNSSYGGTPIESWIPQEHATGTIYDSKRAEREEEIQMNTLGQEAAEDRYEKWMEESQKSSSQELAERDFSNLDKLSLPNYFFNTPRGESLGGTFLYKQVEIPNPIGLTLELPQIDRNCQIFFNGFLVHQEILPSQAYRHPRVKIPTDMVRAGKNVIAINLVTSLWNGGIVGDPSEMRLVTPNDTISLAGEWHFLKTFELYHVRAQPKEGLPNAFLLSSLYNGMIHAIGKYSLKGFLWYQGEANVGNAVQYPDMLSDMVKGWRENWGAELPFYYVQIAPYKQSGHENTEVAEMRAAMSQAYRRIPNSDVVLTGDLGNPENIHPARKREVGERLALKALYSTYGDKRSGIKYPEISKVTISDGAVILKLRNTYGKLSSLSDTSSFELSEDGKIFFKSEFKISGNEIRIYNNSIKNPKFVQHAYRNSSAASVCNAMMLPLDTFSINIEPK